MADDRLSELLHALESSSQEYAHLTTRLSDHIATIENRLNSLPAKIPVSVNAGDELSLEFARLDNRWGVLLHRVGAAGKKQATLGQLRDVSVELKLRAWPHLQDLVEKLVQQQNARLKMLRNRLEKIESTADGFGNSTTKQPPVNEPRLNPEPLGRLGVDGAGR